MQELFNSSASFRAQLMRGGAGTLVTMVCGKLLLLAISAALAHILGASQYGSYAFAMAVVGLLAIPLQLGFPQLLIRRSAIFQYRDQLSALKGLLLSTNRITLVSSIVFGGLAAVIILVLPVKIPAGTPETMLWALVLLPLLGLSGLRAATLRGLGRIVWSLLPESMLQPLMLLLLLGATLLFAPAWTLTDTLAVQIHVIAQAFAFAVGIWLLYIALPAGIRNTEPQFDTARWLREALPYLLLAGAPDHHPAYGHIDDWCFEIGF
ncbi:MAG: hypothetical protein U5P41_09510 [Gammaproteobacteria bacterium]|nr:hypothetical protein [Gammaproteobacteria bacterium]